MEENKEKENSVPASETETTVSPEEKQAQEVEALKQQLEEKDNQLFQAGHVIQELKKKKEPEYEPDLDSKIQEKVAKALEAREAEQASKNNEEKFKTLLKERDELAYALRSRQNTSSVSGGGQRQPEKEVPKLTSDEERLARAFKLSPEEIINSRK